MKFKIVRYYSCYDRYELYTEDSIINWSFVTSYHGEKADAVRYLKEVAILKSADNNIVEEFELWNL